MKVKFQALILGVTVAMIATACAPDPLKDLTVEETQVFTPNRHHRAQPAGRPPV